MNEEERKQDTVEPEDKAENAAYRKKIAVRFLIVLAVAAAVLLIANLILDRAGKTQSSSDDEATESVRLFETDYDYDIFTDEFYTELERWMNYTYGGMTTRVFTEEDAEKTDRYAEFFFSYFDALVHGEYEGFDSFFTEEYLKKHGSFGRFTMQQIYNISVDYLTSESDDETGEIYHVFRVAFAIRRNNGTVFRYSESNKTIPYLYQIIESADGSIGINLIKR
ncbi:MAG: hypothetical protein IKX86_03930 [Clostridia bacterium]|nr:hypothetical protein [Clostridia bacterium]